MSGQAEFETALRHDVPWITATDVAIQSEQESQGKPLTGKSVPDADPDRELIWTVGVSTVRINLSALLALPAVARDTHLDATNSIVHSIGSTLCMLARSDEPTSQFLFSADVAGNYSVEIAVSSIDLEPWARRSNAGERIPAEKLPARLTAKQKLLHNGTAQGLRIRNTNNRTEAQFRKLGTTFDLNENRNRTGDLHVVMTVTITSSGLGFGPDLDTTHTFTAVVFASDVYKLDTFVERGNQRVEIDSSVDLYEDATTKLGALSFYLAKSSENELGYLLDYLGGGTVAADVTLSAAMEVVFSPTDALTDATSSSGHVGPLIATLTIPSTGTGRLAAHARPDATWALASGPPTRGFSAAAGNNGRLNVPRVLPDTMAGVVVRTKVNGTTVSQVFLPWIPNLEDVAWDAQIPGVSGTNVYQLLVDDSNDSTVRTVKLLLERDWNGANDLLYVVGNDGPIKPGTTIELCQWV